ncbi:hypothetical protein QBC47DRAFT_370312 [Echria macrotheca]|uniref:Uncharacterized protein n=1 Tax=Echria macrotheca TaxID=438768 RepID=A0AAJ0BNE9_9PEZI|nr:hypothetical protein QBC47DRAFT_370312 [Echria macrotheca]
MNERGIRSLSRYKTARAQKLVQKPSRHISAQFPCLLISPEPQRESRFDIMVSVRLVLATLASHVFLAASSPTPSGLDTRVSVLAVEFCDSTNFRGVCVEINPDSAQCYDLLPDWDNRASSVDNLGKDSYKCTWYLDGNCQGTSYDNQKDADLGDGNGLFDESISSFICVPK